MPLKQLLIVRTAGNPFFLEESVRTLVEAGVLVGEPEAYRLTQALPTIQVPATVQAVLAARGDRLPGGEGAPANGCPWWAPRHLAAAQAIADLPEVTLHRGLAHLRQRSSCMRPACSPKQVYTFKHALTHEVAYGGLLEQRRGLHTRLVEAIEALAPRAGGRAGRTPGAPCSAGRDMG